MTVDTISCDSAHKSTLGCLLYTLPPAASEKTHAEVRNLTHIPRCAGRPACGCRPAGNPLRRGAGAAAGGDAGARGRSAGSICRRRGVGDGCWLSCSRCWRQHSGRRPAAYLRSDSALDGTCVMTSHKRQSAKAAALQRRSSTLVNCVEFRSGLARTFTVARPKEQQSKR